LVETTNNGQRFVSQTLNPKSNLWNNPKKSTYSNIILIGLNEQEHITYTSLTMYSLEEANKFKTNYDKYLSDYQRTELINIIKMLEVYDQVEFKIKAQRFRNILTGEITEAIDLMQLDNYEEVDEEGNPIDPDNEKQKQKNINRKINSLAISNASKETGVDSAIKTFKRAR